MLLFKTHIFFPITVQNISYFLIVIVFFVHFVGSFNLFQSRCLLGFPNISFISKSTNLSLHRYCLVLSTNQIDL